MSNTFLTTHMAVDGPLLVQELEGEHMADEGTFPRWMYPAGGPTEPDYGGRCFDDQAALDAAEGEWYPTPQEAQAAGTAAPRLGPTPPSVPRPTPNQTPDEDDEGPVITPRSRR